MSQPENNFDDKLTQLYENQKSENKLSAQEKKRLITQVKNQNKFDRNTNHKQNLIYLYRKDLLCKIKKYFPCRLRNLCPNEHQNKVSK